jgi:hypothetical protein
VLSLPALSGLRGLFNTAAVRRSRFMTMPPPKRAQARRPTNQPKL